MIAFKWTVIAIWIIAGLSSLADLGKHGKPRPPYNATVSGIGAVLCAVMIAWALQVLP